MSDAAEAEVEVEEVATEDDTTEESTEEVEVSTDEEEAEAEVSDAMFENEDGSMTVDLSSTEDGGWDVIPRGIYPVIVDDAEYKISQTGGNPMISLTLQIEEGEFADRKLFTHVVFSPKAMPMARRAIARLGLNHLLEGPFNPEDKADDFIGARCRARVTVEKYEGEDTNKVKSLLPAQDGDEFAEG